jgi:hypothetical protein
MDRMELYNSAFVIEEIDTSRYNQIKGKNLTGYFKDDEIYLLNVRGNCENIYFALEEDKLVGVNQATCAKMDIYFEDGEIKDIYMLKSPDGTLDPPLQTSPTTRRLEKFLWLNKLRPKDRYDIFRKDN